MYIIQSWQQTSCHPHLGASGVKENKMQYNPIKSGQAIDVMVSDGCEVTINRPDGTVEVLKNPGGYREMNSIIFAKIQKATKAAGRGNVVSFKNLKKPAVYKVTDADAATDSSAQISRIMKAGE